MTDYEPSFVSEPAGLLVVVTVNTKTAFLWLVDTCRRQSAAPHAAGIQMDEVFALNITQR